ncbi:cytochrome c-type biogenesis protein CcmH [Micromonospora sp. NPDC049679]|uniref:cytochrome c-type biogenesis protein CcmH n=1 Tax=Micromonospora sp. NPDC049679 TaxID=3155920 RepID=UPI003408AE51
MTRRRVVVFVIIGFLALGAGAAMWRSIRQPAPDPARQLGAGLRCPACQGESVADSRSPMAAAMRDVIAAQVAAGRSPEQIRDWFVQRYGPEVLATPQPRGVGLLLWVVPAIVLAGGLGLALRARRRRTRPRTPATMVDAGSRRGAERTWNLAALCLIALVVGVALAGPRLAEEQPRAAPSAAADLALARSLEQQGRYAAAVELYRDVLRRRPDDQLRLRLAFALIRAGEAPEAARVAEQVLAVRPDDPDTLLMLGLARREAGSPLARETLRRFLNRAPEHSAATEIRRLLEAEGPPR